MKNIKKLFGIIAFATVIVLTMTACPDGNGDKTPVTSFPLGPTLNLSGQVYTWDYFDYNTEAFIFTPFSDNETVTAVYYDENDNSFPLGGNGAITNGQLSFSIGTPAYLVDISEGFEVSEFIIFNNFTISSPAAKAAVLSLETSSDILMRVNETNFEGVQYFYVDSDVTISAGHSRFFDQGLQLTVNAFTIHLKEGWNALYSQTVQSSPSAVTITLSAANPGHLMWVLHDADDNGNSHTSAPLGPTLNLSGQVHTVDYYTGVPTFLPFSGNEAVTAVYYDENNNSFSLGGNGAITTGQLSFNIGTPTFLVDISEFFFPDINTNITISAPTTKAAGLSLEAPSGFLARSNLTATFYEAVRYIYVASDVTISAGHSVFFNEGMLETINAFTIYLKTGWNAINESGVLTSPSAITYTLSAANPGHLMWVLHEDMGGPSPSYGMNMPPQAGNSLRMPLLMGRFRSSH
ncbi:MAG: hypothetical protein FWG89_02155 [Treponema sp.]|nr:hypothetical protein [Treponema sp.]